MTEFVCILNILILLLLLWKKRKWDLRYREFQKIVVEHDLMTDVFKAEMDLIDSKFDLALNSSDFIEAERLSALRELKAREFFENSDKLIQKMRNLTKEF